MSGVVFEVYAAAVGKAFMWKIDYDEAGLLECSEYDDLWPTSAAAVEAGEAFLIEHSNLLVVEALERREAKGRAPSGTKTFSSGSCARTT